MNKQNQNNKEIKIIVKNAPNEELSAKMIKELCIFLSKTWYLPIEKKR